MLKKPTKFEISVIIQKLKEEAEKLKFQEHESLIDVLDLLIKEREDSEKFEEEIIKIREKL